MNSLNIILLCFVIGACIPEQKKDNTHDSLNPSTIINEIKKNDQEKKTIKKSSDMNVKYYSDFDYINLHGRNELNPQLLQFPFVEVHYEGNYINKTISHFDEENKVTDNYKFVNGHYTRISTNEISKSKETYEVFYLDSMAIVYHMVTFFKDNVEKKCLSSFIIYKQMEKTEYLFGMDRLYREASSKVLDEKTIKEKCFKIFETKYYLTDNILREEVQVLNRSENFISNKKNIKCYDISGYSIFWWNKFGYAFKQGVCNY